MSSNPLNGTSISNIDLPINKTAIWHPFEHGNQMMELSPKTFDNLLSNPYYDRYNFWKSYF